MAPLQSPYLQKRALKCAVILTGRPGTLGAQAGPAKAMGEGSGLGSPAPAPLCSSPSLSSGTWCPHADFCDHTHDSWILHTGTGLPLGSVRPWREKYICRDKPAP